jgi:hypothetical protein
MMEPDYVALHLLTLSLEGNKDYASFLLAGELNLPCLLILFF